MTRSPDHSMRLHEQLQQRILLLDGAMGTMIQRHQLEEADYRGERFADWSSDLKGNNDLLVLTQPTIIRDIHAAYLAAGADIIETNTFNANRVSMADYGMESLCHEINLAAARLAMKAPVATSERGARRLMPPPARRGRVSSPALLARPTAPARSRPMSTTRAFAISVSTSWSRLTARRYAD